jgi:ribosome-interacting GTPase 1
MPVNAPAEYFKAEQKFKNAKSHEDKVAALEEMIRLLPKHHGSENAHAQLRARLAKLRKEGAAKKKAGRKLGVPKEGEAQVCIVGFTNSGKSTLLAKLTDAKPEIGSHPFTTRKAEVGMMDYRGVKIQLVEIPSTFQPEYMSTLRSTDAIILVGEDRNRLEHFLEDNFVRQSHIFVDPFDDKTNEIKNRIWEMLKMIIVYTKDRQNKVSPMALPANAFVRDFAGRIHKDFIKNFRFARIKRNSRIIQAGLEYRLEDGDIVEIYA